ncbi:MAG: efflux RND transporter permease subunit, partial [Bacteroidota bacterium]
MSFVFVEMKDGTNVDIAIADAQRKVNAVESQLPENAEPPALTKFSSDEFPILSIGATAKSTPTEFFDLINDRIKPAISSVKGVGEVRIIGGQEREIQVNVNRQALEARGMTILQVVQAVQSANLDFPTGKIENPSEQILIRLAGKFQTVEDLRSLVVTTRNGAPVKLGEIAEVVDSQKDLLSLSRVNGKEALGLQVLKTTDANAVEVANGVIKKLDELKLQFNHADSAEVAANSPSGVGGAASDSPSGVGGAAALNLDFAIANNQTDFTKDAVEAVWHDLLLAILLVAIVMLFFLHSFRNALIVMLAIPTSLITTGILMYAAGFTLNLMTLLAMSLVIGILVDDSIVVLENTYRHMEQGMKPRKAALLGRNEIAFTALSITLVDVVVFLPISFMTGIVGNIMRSFALVVVFSTMVSLLVSFTLTPMLASRFSKVERFSNRNLIGLIFNGFERILHRITEWYARLISRILNPIRFSYSAARVRRLEQKEAIDGRPRKKHFNFYFTGIFVLAATIIAFVASFGLIGNGYIGTAFIQPGDRGEFILKLELPKDATLQETNLAAKKTEDFLAKKPEITGIFSTVGAASGMFAGQSSNYIAELTMKLVPQDERGGVHTDLYAQQVRNELERQQPGVKFTSAPVSFFGGADEDPIQVFVAGADKAEVMKYASAALAEIQKVPGTLEAKLSIEEGSPEVRVSVDRDRMAKLGLDLATVGMTMQTAYNGNDDVQFRSGDKEYDITVKMDDFNRSSISDIANLAMMNNQGQLIRLSQFADITQTTGPNQLERNDRQPSVTIKSKVLGRPSGAVGAD